ncbi:hypothetical protein [Pseudoduganella rhizocola]|uniref:hypothetical protein n=1 Tax=Pseudoduganella rhizocola TaxID=3382643 RepID=UPI0038B4830A
MAAAALLAVLAAGASWLAARELQDESTRQLAQLRRAPAKLLPAAAPSRGSLPAFSSAVLAERFNQTAIDIGLPPDEISYTLDAPPGQPYQRYRLTFPVKSNYPTIRRFVAALATEMPHVALDGIRCSRENTSSPVLACDLTFSAFFERERNE